MQVAANYFSYDNFMSYGHCYLWPPHILWTHVLSDAIIGLSYLSILFVLYVFARKRPDLAANKILYLLVAFIVLCGLTHFMSIYTVWVPAYFQFGLVKVAAASVSLMTAVLLWPLLPKLANMPSVRDLGEANAKLSLELDERQTAELKLKEGKEELERTNANLREAMNALRASEERLALAIEGSQINLWDWNIETGEYWFSDRWLKILGYSASEFQFHFDAWEKRVHPDDKHRVMAALHAHLESDERFNLQFRMRCKSGEYVWIEAFGKARKDKNGKPVRMTGTLIDISENKRAQSDLERNEAFLKAVLENVQDGIVACDEKGVLVLFNRAAREFHGVDVRPIRQENWAKEYDLYDSDGTTPLKSEKIPLARALAGETVSNQEMAIAPKGRPKRFLIASAAQLKDSKMNLIGAVAAIHDVTSERAALAELRRKTRELGLIFDHVPVELWCKDEDDRIVRLNKMAADAIGLSVHEAEGVGIDQLPARAPQRFHEDDRKIIESGEAAIGVIGEHVGDDGTKYWVRTDRIPYIDEETGEKLMFVSSLDLTPIMKVKAELTRSNEELEQFTRVASHDLQEPLRKIIFFSEFLERDLGRDLTSEAKADLDAIVAAGRRMQNLIKGFLSLARMGGGEISLSVIDPKACIEAALRQIRLPSEKQIQFSFAPMPAVIANADHLAQVFQNLIANAAKFAPPDSKIVIEFTAEQDGNTTILGVRDNGIGVPPEHRTTIFEPLTRLHSRDAYEGSGIGLAICKKTVEHLGGEIWVDPNPSGGSHFKIRLRSAPEA